MAAVVIVIGNPVRRDDGVAHHVRVETPGVATRAVLQLTPEMAEEVAPYSTVIFVDADVNAQQLRIQPIDAVPAPSALTHVLRPAEIVAMARTLFGFSGSAYTCHIPVSDLSEGEGISTSAQALARQAGAEIDNLLALAIK
jgi:Ni,Fe-hydrogenase maturation factor